MPTGSLGNAYELVNLGAHTFSLLNKLHAFPYIGNIFYMKFHKVPLKFRSERLRGETKCCTKGVIIGDHLTHVRVRCVVSEIRWVITQTWHDKDIMGTHVQQAIWVRRAIWYCIKCLACTYSINRRGTRCFRRMRQFINTHHTCHTS